MSDAVIGLLTSLSALMEEENALLEGGSWPPDNAALAAAKLRLTGALETMIAEQERTAPDWLHGCPPDSPLGEAVVRLRDLSARNADLLARQMSLSQELLQEIAREAGRLGGTRQQTYRRGGGLDRRDDPPPVSVNTRL